MVRVLERTTRGAEQAVAEARGLSGAYAGSAGKEIPEGKSSVRRGVIRCVVAMGCAGLPGAGGGEADSSAPDGDAAAGRSGVCNVPQQKARRIPEIPRGRYEQASSALGKTDLHGAKGVSEPRDPGIVRQLPDHQDLYWPGPIARDAVPQVRTSKTTGQMLDKQGDRCVLMI